MPGRGDPIAIAAYMGKGDTLDRAIADFGESYARAEPQRLRRVSCCDRRAAAPGYVDPVTYDAGSGGSGVVTR